MFLVAAWRVTSGGKDTLRVVVKLHARDAPFRAGPEFGVSGNHEAGDRKEPKHQRGGASS